MIVEPDFFEHWKTKALVELTHRLESPLWIQRLWAHCQQRRAWRFNSLPPVAIKVICGAASEVPAEDVVKALVDSRFIEKDGDVITVHDWKKHNAQLLARWSNGSRPKAKRQPSEREATQKPQPSDEKRPVSGPESDGKRPVSGPSRDRVDRVDKSRVEKRRLDKKHTHSARERDGAESVPDAVGREVSRPLPAELDVVAFRSAWERWLVHWSEAFGRGRVMPLATADAHLAACLAIAGTGGAEAAIGALELAIRRGLREPAGKIRGELAAAEPPFDPTKPDAYTGGMRDFTAEAAAKEAKA